MMDGMISVEDRFEQVLDQAIDGIVSIDGHNNVTYMNRAAERLWRIDKRSVLGKNVNMLVPKAIRADHDRMVGHNRQTGQDRIVGKARDMEMERADGTTCWVNFSLSKVIGTNGEVTYTAFVRDISEQRAALAATADAIKLVAQAIEQIGRSGQTVNDLAERTNLLAINASIEAARAGERGRAFGIVANEVKRLAENTRKAAAEVDGIVTANRRNLTEVENSLKSLS